jgi:hypothetical protein
VFKVTEVVRISAPLCRDCSLNSKEKRTAFRNHFRTPQRLDNRWSNTPFPVSEPKLTTKDLYVKISNLTFCTQYIFAVGVVDPAEKPAHPARNIRTIGTLVDELSPPEHLQIDYVPDEEPCLLIRWSASCPNIATPLGYSVRPFEPPCRRHHTRPVPGDRVRGQPPSHDHHHPAPEHVGRVGANFARDLRQIVRHQSCHRRRRFPTDRDCLLQSSPFLATVQSATDVAPRWGLRDVLARTLRPLLRGRLLLRGLRLSGTGAVRQAPDLRHRQAGLPVSGQPERVHFHGGVEVRGRRFQIVPDRTGGAEFVGGEPDAQP